MHIDTSGDAAGLHNSHPHHVGIGDYDHAEDVDVQVLVKVGTSWSKLIPLLLACAIVLIALGWVLRTVWVLPARLSKLFRLSRLRPPLRAPPTLV